MMYLEIPQTESSALYLMTKHLFITNTKYFKFVNLLFFIVTDPNISSSELNHDLEVIENWSFQSKIFFNPEPSKQGFEVSFSTINKPLKIPFTFSYGN